ncbi:MAG TPA: hypothetical protein VN873_15440 [Candidatus Angelobacter sp.]|nr:hypothetical protein [Candidatus Angelobacter sp.]
MRTKTLLLSAAAIVAGILSSQAQSNVFSANVVGYVSVVFPGNGQYQLCANPFDDGNGNYVTNVLGNSLPKQSQVLVWNGTGYNIITRGGTPAAWPVGTTQQIPPGVGFFVKNGFAGSPPITNVFVGSIVVPNGGSVTNQIPVGYTLLGSPIPYAGNVAIAGQSGGDTNLDFGDAVGKQSQILVWDSASQGYATIATKGGTPPTWLTSASITPGQGFFILNKLGPATNVVQNLNLQ